MARLRSRRPYAQRPDFDALSGEGALLVSGRWHTARPELRIVYAAEHPALALLELYVHVDHAMHRYALVEFLVEIPGVAWPPASVLESPDDVSATRAFVNAWYAGDPNFILKVPSALVPKGFNYLVRIDGTVRLKHLGMVVYPLDRRLAGRL